MTQNILEKISIPEISDEKLQELCARIVPVTRIKKDLWHIKPADLRKRSFICNPEPTEKAEDLKHLQDIKTCHVSMNPTFFTPSVAEVLAQIPEELIGEVVAFEIVEFPKFDDISKNEGYDQAITRLYGRK